MPEAKPDRHVLLQACDGPENICLYTSTDEGVVDWGNDLPALYLEVSLNGVYTKIGPFQCPSIREFFEDVAEVCEDSLDDGSMKDKYAR